MTPEQLWKRTGPVQLATLVKQVPDRPDAYAYELKFDGYRIIAARAAGALRLFSRRGQDWTAEFDPIARAVGALAPGDFVIDGEVCALDERGVPSFQRLQNRSERASHLVYYVFDLLWADGEDLRRRPIEERRERLARIASPLPTSGAIALSAAVGGDPAALLAKACRGGLEGLIAKERGSPYAGGRQTTWLKIKCTLRQEFAIAGYLPYLGTERGRVGSLLLALKAPDGRFDYAGKVGTGFDLATRASLGRLLERTSLVSPPVRGAPRLGGIARWSRLQHVAEVAFTEWTEGGHVRHPSFQGLRADKSPDDCVREAPSKADDVARAAGDTAPAPVRADAARRALRSPTGARRVVIEGIGLSHPDRVLDPAGVTKVDLARYYEAVAPRMVPHVRGRPLTLLRWAEGKPTEKGGVFIRHARAWGPRALRRVPIPEKTKIGEYLVADDAAGLVALAQMDVLEIHTWNSTVDDVERPDRIVLDLDPGPGVSWAAVADAARHLRVVLRGIGLASWVKTTGGKGLHVVVPIRRGPDWSTCLAFARTVATTLEQQEPASFTAQMAKPKREGRIFIDYLRNNRTNTSIAAYSIRAKPGAPVSLPIAWSELAPTLDAAALTPAVVVDRLGGAAGERPDPWRDYWTCTQELPRFG